MRLSVAHEEGVQKFRSCRSSGVQEFRSSGVQEFRSSGGRKAALTDNSIHFLNMLFYYGMADL
jgi:hypothetical protein